jgi:hypothetical protein
MFTNPSIAGSWPALCARLDDNAALTQWASREPAFDGIASVEDLTAAVAADVDEHRRDAVFGALVRLAAVDASPDVDVVTLLLHLLSPGAFAVARSLAGLCEDRIRLVVAELAVQIRAFPAHRRHRAFAANLLLDTRRVPFRELLSAETPAADLRTHLGDGRRHRSSEPAVLGPYDDPDLNLPDVLTWAERTGVVTGAELRLLLEVACAKEAGGAAQLRVAAARQINERTLRRRQDKALASLRAASGAYLSACA